jgi:hypothetical protein
VEGPVGIQQILKKMRDADRAFHAKVRIGIHIGSAIVEQKDVFGDAVNVAKRVESFGGANEIYLSEETAGFVSDKKHSFHKKGSFIPKGKREPMTVYRCRWNEYKDLARGLKISSDYPLDPREKGDVVAYSMIAAAVVSLLYLVYIRYLAVDMLGGAYETKLLLLNPALSISEYPTVWLMLLALVLSLVLLLIWLRTIPYIFLRLLKGIAGFGLGFMLVYGSAVWFGWTFGGEPGQQIMETGQRFIHAGYPDVAPLVDLHLKRKSLYEAFDRPMVIPVLSDSSHNRQLKRVLTGLRARRTPGPPAHAGVWNTAGLAAYPPRPFVFRLLDLCALAAGVMGFVSGFMNFSISPR